MIREIRCDFLDSLKETIMNETILEVKNLCKDYESFRLQDLSFTMQRGRIMGLIGRNGAGKTTTMKSMLNMIRRSGGSVSYFGMDITKHEREIKQRIGYAGSQKGWYTRKRISEIGRVTLGFYENADPEAFAKYLELFDIDPRKRPFELSEGMKVKLSIALALSHHAELLILDEPTSGLDPVSRDELLDLFCWLRDEGVSILFSTHITSDLDKCADDITYIAKGRMLASAPMEEYLQDCREKGLGTNLEEIMISCEKEENYHEKHLF